MNVTNMDLRRGIPFGDITIQTKDWVPYNEGQAFECRVIICPEASGGYSAYVSNLPGIVSEGDSEAETLANISDAFRGAILSYRDGGLDIPWTEDHIERPAESKERWILVNV